MNLSLKRIFSQAIAMHLTIYFISEVCSGMVKGGDEAECCSRIKHPYFVKELEASTTDDIDLRLCLTIIALELIKIYIQ